MAAFERVERSGIRRTTGCSVVAVETDGETLINPAADLPLPGAPAELIMVGTTDAQREFIEKYFQQRD